MNPVTETPGPQPIELEAADVTALAASADAVLLDFLAPGIIHALGNSIFAVRGCAHVLGASKQIGRQRETILAGCDRAERAVDVLRHFGPADGDPLRAEQAGILLLRMLEVCRVPLRERGVRLEICHSSKESPRRVDGRTLARSVAEVLRCVALEVPACFSGEVRLDLCEQDRAHITIDLELRTDPGCLPFPIGLSAARANSAQVLNPLGVRVEIAAEDRLRIVIPPSTARR